MPLTAAKVETFLAEHSVPQIARHIAHRTQWVVQTFTLPTALVKSLKLPRLRLASVSNGVSASSPSKLNALLDTANTLEWAADRFIAGQPDRVER